jgi:hypothetical protein
VRDASEVDEELRNCQLLRRMSSRKCERRHP